jgi:hypothetical protein
MVRASTPESWTSHLVALHENPVTLGVLLVLVLL